MHAIRFNSLVSVPIAILSAYTIYWIFAFALSHSNKKNIKIAVSVAALIILSYFFYNLLLNDNAYSSTLTQADSINPQFITAMQWLKANSPNSSVVLTLWPDGSVVEGVANRTSITDSVGAQDASIADPFAAWILNSSSDPQFLTGPLSDKPNYLLVRNSWLVETQGIFTEATIPENASLFGYLPIYSFVEGAPNATERQLILTNNQQGQYPFAVINFKTENTQSPILRPVNASIQIAAGEESPFKYLAFYNSVNGNYTFITNPSNQTNSELLLVLFSTVQRQSFFINVTGSYIFAPGIAQSNMLKFLYFCNDVSCMWDTPNETARLVYSNLDSKIFKLTYHNSTLNYT